MLAKHLTDIGSVLACTLRQQYTLPDQSAIERSCDKPHYVVPKRNNKLRLIQNLRPVWVVNDSCCMVTFSVKILNV